MKTLAVIPARAGSKRLPRKNVKPLRGEPMIAWTIRAALDCPAISKVVVSTDDEEVAALAKRMNVRVIARPAELATDAATSESVVKHALSSVGEKFDRLVLLQPTSPLRTSKHLSECLERMTKDGTASSLSVTALHLHPSRNFKVENGKLIPYFGMEALRQPMSELPAAYRPNGAIYAIDVNAFEAKHAFFVEPCSAYVMDTDSSVDVDTLADFELCESILSRRAP